MALSPTINFDIAVSNPDGGTVAPMSLSATWAVAISGGVNSADASRITDPTTEITADTRRIITCKGKGTHVCLTLKYDDGLTSITAPKIAVFGRTSGQRWERLVSLDNADSVTLTPDTTNDASDGTFNWTTITNASMFDRKGCDEILVGVETALAATGTVTTATIEAKLI